MVKCIFLHKLADMQEAWKKAVFTESRGQFKDLSDLVASEGFFKFHQRVRWQDGSFTQIVL